MRILPTRHLSVRVPWHDNGWDGTVCSDPENNASCLFLSRLQDKDTEKEELFKTQCFESMNYENLPPCVDENVTFMSTTGLARRKKHPYSDSQDNYKHFKETLFRISPYSVAAIPFRWMLKDIEDDSSEVAKDYDLDYHRDKEVGRTTFPTTFVQHHENQRELLETFFSAIKPQKSLVFFYAKHVPLSDSCNRVLIGAAIVEHVGEIIEYDYSQKRDNNRGYLWERDIKHSLRPNNTKGFLMPYSEILLMSEDLINKGYNLEDFVAPAPDHGQFSYAAEHVTHDKAIDALIIMRDKLKHTAEALGEDYSKVFDWINDQLSYLWNMRGAFPGLGAVLTAFGLAEGNVIAWEIEKIIREKDGDELKTNPWQLVGEMFANWGKAHQDKRLAKHINNTDKETWDFIDDNKKKCLKLLSRFELNNDQAKKLYESDDFEQIIKNPYLIYENSRFDLDPISIFVADKAICPINKISEAFPLPEISRTNSPKDKRRIRAFIVHMLEQEASAGNTVVEKKGIIKKLKNLGVEPSTEVTEDNLSASIEPYFEYDFNTVVRVISNDNNTFYKLEHLYNAKEIIVETVSKRVGKKLNIDIDWKSFVDEKLKNGNTVVQNEEKERVARAEKTDALKVLTTSRFSVLIGPAGTGKTKLLSILFEIPEIEKGGILKLATTGKARVNLKAGGKTIAQYLLNFERYDEKTGRYFLNENGENDYGKETAIIDESSMLTEDQLAAVFETLNNSGVKRIILIGDYRQLPPIGAGRPFYDIVNYLRDSSPENVAELKTVMRASSTESKDVDFARLFSDDKNAKQFDQELFSDVFTNKVDNIRTVQWNNVEELNKHLSSEFANALDEMKTPSDIKGFHLSLGAVLDKNNIYYNVGSESLIDNWQIITPHNGEGHGVKAINQAIQKKFNRDFHKLALNVEHHRRQIAAPAGNDNVFYGCKVMNTRNMKNTRFFVPEKNRNSVIPLGYVANGEIGIINGEFRAHNFSSDEQIKIRASFVSQQGCQYSFSGGRYAEDDSEFSLQLAYAITIHKAQGSGFKKTFLILPQNSSLLSRELLYTSLTRHHDQLIILYQGDWQNFAKYASIKFSESAKRLTDLFVDPVPVEYEGATYDSNHIHLTIKGEPTRSKSETIIANILHSKKVKYHYEEQFTGSDGRTLHPDFVINDDNSGIKYFWEHLGMLNDYNYTVKWEKKKRYYSNQGFKDFREATDKDNNILIITRDDEKGGLNSQLIENIVINVIKKGKLPWNEKNI